MKPSADAPETEALEATVIASLPNGMFRLRLPDGRQITGHAAQNTRMAFVRLVEGDVVAIELSPFDTRRARILSLIGKHRTRPSGIAPPQASTPSKNPYHSNHPQDPHSPGGQREEP